MNFKSPAGPDRGFKIVITKYRLFEKMTWQL
jgi:hypothetical protein